MLWITSSLAMNKFILKVDNIDRIYDDKLIIEANLLGEEFETRFFTSGARLVFAKLRQTFRPASVLRHFDLECHIQMKIDILDYAISKISYQLTLDGLGQ